MTTEKSLIDSALREYGSPTWSERNNCLGACRRDNMEQEVAPRKKTVLSISGAILRRVNDGLIFHCSGIGERLHPDSFDGMFILSNPDKSPVPLTVSGQNRSKPHGKKSTRSAVGGFLRSSRPRIGRWQHTFYGVGRGFRAEPHRNRFGARCYGKNPCTLPITWGRRHWLGQSHS